MLFIQKPFGPKSEEASNHGTLSTTMREFGSSNQEAGVEEASHYQPSFVGIDNAVAMSRSYLEQNRIINANVE
jgi:hypothetical protein